MCGKGDIWSPFRSRQTVLHAIEMLCHLTERGGVEADGRTGHGVGMSFDLPHELFQNDSTLVFSGLDLTAGNYACGHFFMPKDPVAKQQCLNIIKETLSNVLGVNENELVMRIPPVNNSDLSELARSYEPDYLQILFNRLPRHRERLNTLSFEHGKGREDLREFERKLIEAHFLIEIEVTKQNVNGTLDDFSAVSLSARQLVLKAVARPNQIFDYFEDLKSEHFICQRASVQHRKKTNSPVAPKNAHPYIFTTHNGEINNIEAITEWMEIYLREIMGVDVAIPRTWSDTKRFDLWLAVKVAQGWPLEREVLKRVRPAWWSDNTLSKEAHEFFRYWDSVLPPLMGPAFMSMYDTVHNKMIFVNDHSGDRDSVIEVFKDGTIILASEYGTVPSLETADLILKDQLEGGEMLVLDAETGPLDEDGNIALERGAELVNRIVHDEKHRHGFDYVKRNRKAFMSLDGDYQDFPVVTDDFPYTYDMMRAFGVDETYLQYMVRPSLVGGKEDLGAMNPHSASPQTSKLPYGIERYAKQHAAQVTNRAGDPMNEAYLFDDRAVVGANYLRKEKAINVEGTGIMKPGMMQRMLDANELKNKIAVINCTYDVRHGEAGKKASLHKIKQDVIEHMKKGAEFLILSDRDIQKFHTAHDPIHIGGFVKQILVDYHERFSAGIIIDSGRIWHPHAAYLALSNGVDMVNPYLLYNYAVLESHGDQKLTKEQALENVYHFMRTGLMQIIAKPGDYTVHGAKNARHFYFEGVDLNDPYISYSFRGVTSETGGHGLREFSQNEISQHLASMMRIDPEALLEIPDLMTAWQTIEQELSVGQDFPKTSDYWGQVAVMMMRVLSLTYHSPEHMQSRASKSELFRSGFYNRTAGAEEEYWKSWITAYRQAYNSNNREDQELKALLEMVIDGKKLFQDIADIIPEHQKSLAEYLIQNPDEMWVLDMRYRKDIAPSKRYQGTKIYSNDAINAHEAPTNIRELNKQEYLHRQNNPKREEDFFEFKTDLNGVNRKDLAVTISDYLRDHHKVAPMSEGSVKNAPHQEIATQMKSLGSLQASGEGGLNRHRRAGGNAGDSNPIGFQLASGRHGVDLSLALAGWEVQNDGRMRVLVDVKGSQGAKDGEGGHLPGKKVVPFVAQQRGAMEGEELVSMPTQGTFYSVEGIKRQMDVFRMNVSKILHDQGYKIQDIQRDLEVSYKVVANPMIIDHIVVALAESGANVITIGDGSGGTAAAKLGAIIYTGGNALLCGYKAHYALVKTGYRDKVNLEISGGVSNSYDAVMAHAFGYDRIQMGRRSLERISGCKAAATCFGSSNTTGGCPAFIMMEAEKHNMPRRQGERETIYFIDDVLTQVAALGFDAVAWEQGNNSICGRALDVLNLKSPEELQKLGVRGDWSALSGFIQRYDADNIEVLSFEGDENKSVYVQEEVPDLLTVSYLPELAAKKCTRLKHIIFR